MANIRDVAKLSGTSVSAVSAVLNGNGKHNIRVGEATRKRIQKAAEQLAYSPNPLAQGLVTGKTGVLGLVFPYSHAFVDRNPFCAQVMSGVFNEVIDEKYNLMLHTAIGDDWNAVNADALIDARVDGLLLVLPKPDSEVVARCLQKNFPFVAICYESTDPRICAINADEFAVGKLATEHLINLGHRRIAHLVGKPGVSTSDPRFRGYLAALEAAGIEPDPSLIVQSSFDAGEGYKSMKTLLERNLKNPPTAVFAANDLSAEGAIRLLTESGIRVPDDISFVGCDDTWFSLMINPPLTSVRIPITEMGEMAARMLIALIEGKPIEERQPVLPVSLTVRQSSKSLEERAAAPDKISQGGNR